MKRLVSTESKYTVLIIVYNIILCQIGYKS